MTAIKLKTPVYGVAIFTGVKFESYFGTIEDVYPSTLLYNLISNNTEYRYSKERISNTHFGGDSQKYHSVFPIPTVR